ncbi:alpha/beta fold hydrolase [Synechocystis sp. LKSZ1]|uniref:esterase/lipase family protein n=1 Tax=Synechocystis sp. LKSZ1 TaxID=3144951 RepID=UPI00336C1331
MALSRNPVLLVHGIYDTMAKFRAMAVYLQQRGWEVHRLNLRPNNGTAPLDQLAHQVADYVQANFSHQQKIDLLGFSMGGLVTRYYLQRLQGHQQVQRYISISAPNQGTWLGFGLPRAGVWQMRPGSRFLQDLNQDSQHSLANLDVTVLWTPYDLMILPPESSRLGLGQEIQIPVPIHSWMVSDSRVLQHVEQALVR